MPGYPKVNKWFGTISLAVYALFSFKRVREKHWQHHRLPASSKDPDFHDGTHKQVWSWYFHFIRNYFTLYQLIGMAILFNILYHFAISRWSIFSSFGSFLFCYPHFSCFISELIFLIGSRQKDIKITIVPGAANSIYFYLF